VLIDFLDQIPAKLFNEKGQAHCPPHQTHQRQSFHVMRSHLTHQQNGKSGVFDLSNRTSNPTRQHRNTQNHNRGQSPNAPPQTQSCHPSHIQCDKAENSREKPDHATREH
jgi:hypothetical protein